MLVPCPRLEELVHRGAARGVELANAPISDGNSIVVLGAHPDGSVEETTTAEPIETVFKRLMTEGFPLAADAVCLVSIGIEEIDGKRQSGIVLFAAERGAAQSYVLAQPLEKVTFLKRLKFGELRVLKVQPRLVRSPDLDSLIDAALDPMAIVAALRDREVTSWAFNRLRRLGRDATRLVAPLAQSRCSLDRIAAKMLAGAMAIDAVAGTAFSGMNEEDWNQLLAQHPEVPTAGAWIALGLHLGKKADQQTAAVAHTTAVREAPDVIAGEPPLADYWQRLEDVGWLHGASVEELDELRVTLVTAFRDDPLNLHYALAGAVFDDSDLLDDDADEAVRRLAGTSKGQFAPEQLTGRRAAISFTFGGRPWKIAIERDHGIDLLLKGVNGLLAVAERQERFFTLPSADDKVRIVFVRPEMYERALADDVIPGRHSRADERLPRRLRCLRRVRLFKRDVSTLQLVHGNVVILEVGDNIVRLDAPEFKVSWRSPGGWPIRIVDDSVLVRQPGPSAIRMLTLDRGEPVWEHPLRMTQGLRVWRDQVVLLADSIEFLRQDTGEVLRRLPLPARRRVYSHHDFVLVQDDDSAFAIDMVSGERIWPGVWPRPVQDALSYPADGAAHQIQNGPDRVLIVKGRRVFQVRLSRAAEAPELLWDTEFPVPQRGPAVDGNRLFAFDQGHFRCLDLDTGGLVYDREYPELVNEFADSPAAVQGETISFLTFRGGLRMFRSTDGALTARYDGTVLGSPMLFSGRYVVIGQDGWLTEFESTASEESDQRVR